MPDFRSYPNGYIGRPNTLGIQGDPDPEVVIRYNDFIAKTSRNWRWEEEREYLELALRVFGDPAWFLERQLSNPDLCRFRRKYVEDTIEFIQTGVRPVSAYTMSSLFDYSSKSVASRKECFLPKGNACFAKWIAQPNGFNDLVLSMAVFFGLSGPVSGV